MRARVVSLLLMAIHSVNARCVANTEMLDSACLIGANSVKMCVFPCAHDDDACIFPRSGAAHMLANRYCKYTVREGCHVLCRYYDDDDDKAEPQHAPPPPPPFVAADTWIEHE